jgi:hypothetical protein
MIEEKGQPPPAELDEPQRKGWDIVVLFLGLHAVTREEEEG